MNYNEQIFKMFGIKPNEEFELEHIPSGEKFRETYKLDKNLNVWCLTLANGWKNFNDNTLIQILNGMFKIVKTPKLTTEDKIAIEYAKLCDCKYLVKDKDGTCWGSNKNPIKGERHWFKCDEYSSTIDVNYNISFLSWEDEEPFYIGE